MLRLPSWVWAGPALAHVDLALLHNMEADEGRAPGATGPDAHISGGSASSSRCQHGPESGRCWVRWQCQTCNPSLDPCKPCPGPCLSRAPEAEHSHLSSPLQGAGTSALSTRRLSCKVAVLLGLDRAQTQAGAPSSARNLSPGRPPVARLPSRGVLGPPEVGLTRADPGGLGRCSAPGPSSVDAWGEKSQGDMMPTRSAGTLDWKLAPGLGPGSSAAACQATCQPAAGLSDLVIGRCRLGERRHSAEGWGLLLQRAGPGGPTHSHASASRTALGSSSCNDVTTRAVHWVDQAET